MEKDFSALSGDTQIYCLACKTYVDIVACAIQDNGLIYCPKCGKDICNEQ